jgi:hypothetical protein
MTGTLIDAVEESFRLAILTVIGDAANVYNGKSSSNKKLPCVICAADGDSVEEDPPRSGNYWVNVETSVKLSSHTEPTAQTNPQADEVGLLKQVFDILRTNSLADLLNAQGQDLTVLPEGFFFLAPKAGRDEMGAYVDTMPIRLYCCPSKLAA